MERFANLVVAHRRLVLLGTLLITLLLGLQLRNLTVIVDADELLPRAPPFVEVTERVQATPGVARANLKSPAAPRAKDIGGDADGLLVSRLLDHVPADVAEAQVVRARLAGALCGFRLLPSNLRSRPCGCGMGPCAVWMWRHRWIFWTRRKIRAALRRLGMRQPLSMNSD